jgi:hypothetical protein
MARRSHEDHSGGSTPAQQDEADIVKEVGAKPDESGTLMANMDDVRDLGALDPESARENRRLHAVVAKKRANQPDVPWGTNDAIVMYNTMLRVWPASAVTISIKRLTGAAAQHTITSNPRSGAELYEAIKAIHGQNPEAEWSVIFMDVGNNEWRGKAKITMPDTRSSVQQGQPLPQPFYQQPQQPQQQPQAPSASPQQPAVVHVQPAPGIDVGAMFEGMRQMLGMFQTMQRQMTPPAPQQPFTSSPATPADTISQMHQMFQTFQQMFQQMQTSANPPQQPQAPTTAPPSNPAELLGQMQQMFQTMFQTFQQMQPLAAAPSRGGHQQPPPQPQMVNPMAAMGPRDPAPPGMMWGWMPGFGFALMPANGGASSQGQGQGPYRGPHRSPYSGGPGGAPPDQGAPHYQGPPPREKTPTEQFREAVGVIRTAVAAVNEFQEMIPGQSAPANEPAAEDDDSPIRIVDSGVGKLKFAYNKDDSTLRLGETVAMAFPEILKWGAEQADKIQKARNEQRQQPPPQQLPPGYVEVGPGYQPPPGYVAVRVDPSQVPESPLAPPPEYMPPPIQSMQDRQTWSAPTIPVEMDESERK